MVAPNLLQDLPNAALAAVVIAVGDRPVRIRRPAPHLPHPALGVLAVDRLLRGRRGVRRDSRHRLAIVIAVIEFLWDGWRPHSAVLGRADGVEGYHDITRYPEARQIPGLVLFRWDAPLFFANAELFNDRVLEAVAASPTPVRWVVVAAEPVTSVDVTAADVSSELDDSAACRGHRALLRRDEGPGQGQAQALRPVRAASAKIASSRPSNRRSRTISRNRAAARPLNRPRPHSRPGSARTP